MCSGFKDIAKPGFSSSVIVISEWKLKSVECVSVATEGNEVFHLQSLTTLNTSTFLCLSVSPFPGSLSFLLGSQLALFLWLFDLSERVWSFKVLLFPLSGAPLFLLSGLGFQGCGSLVLWLGGLGGTGFYEMVRPWWSWREWACDAVSLGLERTWHPTDPSSTQNPSSQHSQPLVATGEMCLHGSNFTELRTSFTLCYAMFCIWFD